MELSGVKVLVTGATGLLGRPTVKALAKKGASVIAVTYSRSPPAIDGVTAVKCNLLDEEAVEAMLEQHRPDIIVSSAAERRPDRLEGDDSAGLAQNFNAQLPAQLGRYAQRNGAWALQISTDYVFDGTAPPYTPESTPNPVQNYGRSKLAGERAIKAALSNCGILRVPVLYGETEDASESAVTTLATAVFAAASGAAEGPPKKVDNWSVRYPTNTQDVALVISQLVELYVKKEKYVRSGGVWHWSTEQRNASDGRPYTKWTISLVIADVLLGEGEGAAALKGRLAPDDEPQAQGPTPALRPKDCHLDSSVLRGMGVGGDVPLKEGLAAVPALAKMRAELRAGRSSG